MSRKMVWRADNTEVLWSSQRQCDHVLLEALAVANACVEARGNDNR